MLSGIHCHLGPDVVIVTVSALWVCVHVCVYADSLVNYFQLVFIELSLWVIPYPQYFMCVISFNAYNS